MVYGVWCRVKRRIQSAWKRRKSGGYNPPAMNKIKKSGGYNPPAIRRREVDVRRGSAEKRTYDRKGVSPFDLRS